MTFSKENGHVRDPTRALISRTPQHNSTLEPATENMVVSTSDANASSASIPPILYSCWSTLLAEPPPP